FVLTGNLIRITALQDWITPFLHGRVTVYFSGLVFSQFMSNVHASVLLSAFLSPTDAYALLQGVNVGAMGTLIGSLASLISFKFISKTLPAQKKEYIRLYSFLSILMIILVSLIVFLF
ncbi:MAG: hypothetical protein PHP32_07105, partial [Candidatus Izemoplasmatales bacterium]|nr:hypothetical protein [Candidatus Izemoplasmatales bacterium]